MAGLVQQENNMITLENIRVGVKVRKQCNYKGNIYTITGINCRAIINNNSYNCICFVPNYYNKSNIKLVVDIDTFMSNYEIVK